MAVDVAALLALSGPEAFSRWLSAAGDWVEEPNQRRGGESGVKRLQSSCGKTLYRKQQVGHIYRSLRHPLGYPTIMREYHALCAFSRLGVQVPKVVYVDLHRQQRQWHALLVTEDLAGFSSLDECYSRGDEQLWGDLLHQQIVEHIGALIGRLNRERWQHGCLYPKHIFVRVEHGCVDIALLDLEKSRRRLLARQAVRHDCEQLKRRSGWNPSLWALFLKGHQRGFIGA